MGDKLVGGRRQCLEVDYRDGWRWETCSLEVGYRWVGDGRFKVWMQKIDELDMRELRFRVILCQLTQYDIFSIDFTTFQNSTQFHRDPDQWQLIFAFKSS